MIPGGLSMQQARDKGWEPFVLPEDKLLTMYGASNERVTGWVKAGTKVAWDGNGTLRILFCGNETNIIREVHTKTETKTSIKVVEKKVPFEVYVQGPERVIEKRVEVPKYIDRNFYYPTVVAAPQQQYIANLAAPTPVFSQVTGINFGGLGRISINAYGGNGAAAADAAAAAAVAAVTPTSGAATSSGTSSGSAAGGGNGGSGSNSGS
jgi:hypothetical protein